MTVREVVVLTPPCFAQTVVPSHFNVTPANLRPRAVQGRRRYARARRRSRIPTTSRALATFSGGGSWAEPLLKTAHRRIGFGSPPALFRRWEGTPNAELCVGDPEPFPNARYRVWGPIPTEGSPIQGFAFLLPASSACARSLLVPGTCDFTGRRTDASDSAAPCAWSSPTIPAPRTASSLGRLGGEKRGQALAAVGAGPYFNLQRIFGICQHRPRIPLTS